MSVIDERSCTGRHDAGDEGAAWCDWGSDLCTGPTLGTPS